MFLVILLVILEPIVLGIGTWFLFKKYYKPLTTSVKIKKNELEKKDEIRPPLKVYSSRNNETIVRNSGGELIPFNLSEQEKTLLNMFYNED